jgi:hypothetical protein
MSVTECARFEATLAALLAEPDPDPSDPKLAALRAHMAGCAECAGSAELVALAATTAHRREPIEDPGPAYWQDFDRRLRGRLAGRRRLRLAAAAAAAVLLAITIFLARPRAPARPFPAATVPGERALDDAIEGPDDVLGAFSEDDDGLFPSADALSPEDARRLLEWLENEEARLKRGET